MQGAGFLYTDDRIWDHSIAAFRPTYISEEQYNTSARAVFIDSIQYTGNYFLMTISFMESFI